MQNFHPDLLKNFLASVQLVLKFLFDTQINFLKKLSVISSVLIIALRKTFFFLNSSLFKICSKILQIVFKIVANLK